MRKFKESLDQLQLLLENKDHLIDRLNLTDEQKEELKSFFKAHPNYESKIDWNNRNLAYEDFKPILDLEGKSRNSVKKYGLSGKAQIEDLVEGQDYEIVSQNNNYTIYYVKTFKGSEVLAKPTTPPIGIKGRWCIAGKNYSPGTTDQHWIKYTKDGYGFFFVFTSTQKYALSFHIENYIKYQKKSTFLKCFSKDDNQIPESNWSESLQLAITDILKSSTVKDLVAKKEKERQQALEHFKGKLITLKQEVRQVFKDLSEGKIDPKYLKPNRVASSNFAGLEEFQGLSRLDFKDYWLSNFESDEIQNVSQEIDNLIQTQGPSNIKISNSVGVIPQACFYEWSNLKTIELSPSVKVIEASAFRDSGLKSIIIPETVRFLEHSIFERCQSLETVEFKGTMDQIIKPFPTYLFVQCSALKQVILPLGLTVIRGWDFTQCTSLSEINIPDSVVKIEQEAFAFCSSLRKVHWPVNLAVIEGKAFFNCKALRNVNLPDSLTSLGPKVFSNCHLDKLVLPHSLTVCSRMSLCDLTIRKEIIYKGTKQEWQALLARGDQEFSDGLSVAKIWYREHILPFLKFQPE